MVTMHRIKTFFIDFWPTLIVIAVILYATLSSDPIGADKLPLIPHIDKLIHAIMMGGLFSAISFDCQRRDRSKNVLTWRFLLILFAAIVAFSVLDEIMQKIMENGRGAEFLDLAADILGCLIAMFLAPPAIRKVLRLRPA